jgi:hypothetical protein
MIFTLKLAILFHNYNIFNIVLMISCSCRPIDHKKNITLQFNHDTSTLTLFIIDEVNDIILESKLTS